MGHNPPEPLDLSWVTSCLVHRQTIELVCAPCERYIILDVMTVLDRWGDAFTAAHAATRKCRHCGGMLKCSGGLRVAAMQHTGKLLRLIVTDGSSWRWPHFRPPLRPRAGHPRRRPG